MRFLFGDCALDPARRELCRGGDAVHVEPQVFDLLLHLIRNRDHVVSKDDLLSAVWQGRIVSESTLSNRINAARSAIGDSGERQQFIRTVARRGLRFVGAVTQEPIDPINIGAAASPSAVAELVEGRPAPANQEMTFCRTSDGVHLAVATSGNGLPVVKAANWLNHIEYDWHSPIWSPSLKVLANRYRLIRYDERGTGLSDRNVADISFEAFVRDLETVVDALGLERFALWGISQGAAVSVAYAAHHPDRVSRLVVCGGYAVGWRKRGNPDEIARREALTALIGHAGDQDNPAFRQVFTSLVMPDATNEQMQSSNDLQRVAASPETAARLMKTWGDIDVSDLLPRVACPTLVLHSRNDAPVPFEQGLLLAREIPNARFVSLESRNHLILPHEPAWRRYMDEVCAFLDEHGNKGLRSVSALPPLGANARGEQERTAAILAADAAGFTALMERNEESCIRTLAEYRDVIANFVGAHRGRVFGRAGDEFMAEFQSAMDAVRAAVDIQQELSARNAPLPDNARLQFRIGINVGNIAVADNTLLGTAVNIAARLQAAADPGGICISGNVHEQVDGNTDLRFIDLGYLNLKNLAKPVRAYKVERNAQTAVGGLSRRRGKPTVAVMPFSDMNGDPEQDYFSDGATEDIITALSKHRSLLVIARNSTFAFKGHGTDLRRVGIDLGADYIVDGSVRRMDQRVRITVQLIETEGGRQVWTERYDRNLEDMFEVQDEITATIAARIEPEVGTAERLRAERKPPQTLHAWDFFHLGTKHFYQSTLEGNLEAQRLFRRAIELDPKLAAAHAWLSYAIVLSMVYFDADVDDERLNEAVTIAMKGVELDEQDALTHCMLGRALLARRAYGDALAELESAAELNPCLAIVQCGLGDSLAYEGRFGEAIPYFEKAIKLSPYDPQRWAFYSYRALAHLLAREFDQAVEWAQKATRIPNCHYWPFIHRVSALGHLERAEDLPIAMAELLQRKPDLTCGFARERLFYVKNPAHLDLYVEGLRRAGIPE